MSGRDEQLDIPMPAMAPSYRPSMRRQEAMDPATKRLTIFAGIIGTALLGLVGVWAFTGHRSTGVPVIEADSRPVKSKPANPGGLQVEGANDPIFSGDANGKETVAPGPETPAPQALKAEEKAAAQAAVPAGATATPAVPTTAQPTPASIAAAPPPPPVAEPQHRHLAVRHASEEARPNPRPRSSAAIASAEAARRAERLAGHRHLPLIAQATTEEPAVQSAPLQASPPAAGPAPAAAQPAPERHGRRMMVQFAASNSGEAALHEWERLTRKYPDMFSGHTPNITKTVHEGRTYWRIRTGGFADRAQASAFCDKLKSRGGTCVVTSF